MEEKINIAEILKDKKDGIILYSPIFGECTFCCVREDTNDICVKKHNGVKEFFDSKGLYYNTGEVMLFPSKEMRDWSKFAWKRGDVLKNTAYEERVIFDGFLNDYYTYFKGKHPLDCSDKFNIKYHEECNCFTGNYRLESTDAAKTYINTIEERFGGKLNHETLDIENAQHEFKDGDIVAIVVRKCTHIAIFQSRQEAYIGFHAVLCQNDELLLEEPFREDVGDIELRLATDSEKKQLFSALEKKGKRWDSDKKSIVDLNQKVELKPFDKVLVRDFEDQAWQVSLFSYKDSDSYYCCNGCAWNQCIPYIGNESLLGTTKDVEG